MTKEFLSKLLLGSLLVGGGFILAKGTNWQNEPALISQSLRDVLTPPALRPILELDLNAPREKNNLNKDNNTKSKASLPIASNNLPPVASKNESIPIKIAVPIKEEVVSKPQQPALCDFVSNTTSTHKVLINEIAWMGTLLGADNEWLELKNIDSNQAVISNWQIVNAKGSIQIFLTADKTILPGGFYLLERKDDTTMPTVAADQIYSGALANTGEHLKLFDEHCRVVDIVDATNGWNNLGGDNATKHTLERNYTGQGWHTGADSMGTPRAENSNSLPPPPPTGGPPPYTPPPSEPPPVVVTPTSSPSNPPPVSTAPILISEILTGTTADSGAEFIELYNPNDQVVDLTGWELRKRSSSGSESNLLDNAKFVGSISAHGFFLIASPAYTGASAADLIYSVTSASLAYTNNTLVLYRGDHATATVVDTVSWSEIPKDQSYVRTDWVSGVFTLSSTPTPENSTSPVRL